MSVSVFFLATGLSNLLRSLEGDPDLSSVPRELLPKVLQTLYVLDVITYLILLVLESPPF